MVIERIAYTKHAYRRMKRRKIAHTEVKRIINDPGVTYHGNEPDRLVARGYADDGRLVGAVYTEDHDRDADVLVITVIDFGSAL